MEEISYDGETAKKLGQKTSTELDQIEIDKQIREFKENLTELEKEAFDVLMLGSLNRGNLDKLVPSVLEAHKQCKEINKLDS